jgi:hypothetical protein
MTGPEHYQKAEELIRRGEPHHIAEAQVHATLAQAAATALNALVVDENKGEAHFDRDMQEWQQIMGGQANNEQERTERLLALARRQVPAQAKLIGAERRGDTQAAKEAQAELDDVHRQVDEIEREIAQEKGQDR